MIVSKTRLFSQLSLSDVLRGQVDAVQKEVDSIPRDQLLENSDEQVIEYIYSKMEIIPLVIYRDQMSISEPQEMRIERNNTFGEMIRIPGIRVGITIPYTGESDLWKMQPSTFTFNPPRADYLPQRENDQIGILRYQLEYFQGQFESNIINQEIEENLKNIERYLEYIKKDIEAHNPQLKNEIHRQVQQRRERLGTIQSVTKTLNIPIKKRNGTTDPNPVPLHRKMVLPLATQTNRPPEYSISDADYEYILKVIRQEGRSYERTPKPFFKHDEEELRDILMSHLNGHFNGLANGEAFRKSGKTDICIEFENRSAFVAECKLWKGNQKLLEALNQLLGYLTWRDCKTALVVFNKEVAGFAQIQGRIREILQRHPYFVREVPAQDNGEWRIVLRSFDDPGRLVTVHIFLFNLYTN